MARFPIPRTPEGMYRTFRGVVVVNVVLVLAGVALGSASIVVTAALTMIGALYLLYRNSPTVIARPMWKSARTLDDLGEVTVGWLNGTVPTHPLYDGGPDPETFEIREVLLRLNRAGIVTTVSQPSSEGTGAGGSYWRQLAAVSAFVTEPVMRQLCDTVTMYGVKVLSAPAFDEDSESMVVTTRDGEPYTQFGAQDRSDLGFWAGMCSGEAVAALKGTHQVTLVGPGDLGVWNESSILWAAVDRFLDDLERERV